MIQIIHYFVTNAHHAHHLAHVYDWAISHISGRRWAVYPGFKN